jgi:hypothetical protein
MISPELLGRNSLSQLCGEINPEMDRKPPK